MIHARVIKNCGRLLFENARKAQRQVSEEVEAEAFQKLKTKHS